MLGVERRLPAQRGQTRERVSDGCGFIQAPGGAHLLASRGRGFGRCSPCPAPHAGGALSPLWSNLGREGAWPVLSWYTGPSAVWCGLPNSPCLPGVAGKAADNPSEAGHQGWTPSQVACFSDFISSHPLPPRGLWVIITSFPSWGLLSLGHTFPGPWRGTAFISSQLECLLRGRLLVHRGTSEVCRGAEPLGTTQS